MSRESVEDAVIAQDIEEGEKGLDIFKYNYQEYLKLGGIINEKDYRNALDRLNNTVSLDKENPSIRASMLQAIRIAEYAGIELSGSEESPDPIVVLYVILRQDFKPADMEYHHGQMYDERIFGEVLRILGDADSLDKLVNAYPNISFEYKRGK